ncbi:MAG: LOG family protein [Verrucomicrobiae bacterium]|nr:LOG family protein [Verrucomicrobiae bacterium]
MLNKRYSVGKPAFDAQIASLADSVGTAANADLIREIMVTALKLADDKADRGDLKIINAALKELRYAFKLFARYRGTRKVTIFGSARIRKDDPDYLQAVRFARLIAEQNWMVITGGGSGIMEAGHEGAGRDRSFGVNIRLPWEQAANPVIERDRKLITFKYFFTRKLVFLKEADGVVLCPGGFGTHDEGCETLTLIQTGKGRPMPLVYLDKPHGTYWKTWQRYVEDHLLRRGLISKDDMALFKVTDNAEEACREITDFYRNYHSIRFVKDLLVIRLQRAPSPKLLAQLNEEFADINTKFEMTVSGPLDEEKEEPELAHLARLSFYFDRSHWGRLRQMIDVLNRE